MSDIRVNFSDEEAGSEARTFDPLPTGKYHVKITDVEVKECGEESKNPGKPYWNLELTVQDGPYEERKLWTNVMLFNGALYSLAQLMKALDYGDVMAGDFTVPDGDDLISRDVVVTAKKQLDTYAMKRDGTDEKQFKTEVKGFMAWDGTTSTAAAPTEKSSLLP